jgi:hypothetical protein
MTTSPTDPTLLEQMLAGLAGLLPEGQEIFARAMLLALKPADALQAVLAVQVVASHYAMLDALRRAAAPGQSDSMAARQRSNAASIQRVQQAALRALAASRGEAPTGRPRQPTIEPLVPPAPAFVPRRLPPDVQALLARDPNTLSRNERRRIRGYGDPANAHPSTGFATNPAGADLTAIGA